MGWTRPPDSPRGRDEDPVASSSFSCRRHLTGLHSTVAATFEVNNSRVSQTQLVEMQPEKHFGLGVSISKQMLLSALVLISLLMLNAKPCALHVVQ